MIVGGLVAGQGQISLLVLIAIVWACAVARRPHLLHARAPARPRLAAAPRRAAEDHRGAARPGRGLLRAPRRRDDPHRPLHRLRAPARAVHRRRVADAAAALPALRRARRRRCGRPRSASLGYVFWRSFDQLTTYVSRGLFAFGTLVVVDRRRSSRSSTCAATRRRARRSAPGSTSATTSRAGGPSSRSPGPLWHVALGRRGGADVAARFAWTGSRPATLGLELTTLLALLAVGAFTFLLLGDADPQQPASRGIDRMARSTSPTACTRRRSSTSRRSSPTSARSPVTGAARARHRDLGRCVQRRRIEAVALVAGCAARLRRRARHQGRLRPPAPARRARRHRRSRRIPSGHAAYAVALRRLRRSCSCARGVGWATRVAAVTVAVVARRGRRRDPRLPARALPHRRARRGRARRRRSGRSWASLALFAGHVRHNVRQTPMTDDADHLRHRRRRGRDLADRVARARRRPRLEVATGACASGSWRPC